MGLGVNKQKAQARFHIGGKEREADRSRDKLAKVKRPSQCSPLLRSLRVTACAAMTDLIVDIVVSPRSDEQPKE